MCIALFKRTPQWVRPNRSDRPLFIREEVQQDLDSGSNGHRVHHNNKQYVEVCGCRSNS
jgi:hypothetical protein